MDSVAKPVLRWAGSKHRLIPLLLQRAPEKFARYYEPFAGSAALYFALAPKRASLSDFNKDLVNFYRQLKRQPEALLTETVAIPRSSKGYIATRKRFASEASPSKRAALFWYLNRRCFNGLYRTNANGEFNVPEGTKLAPIPSLDEVLLSAKQLRKASICARDYEEAIDEAGRGDFIYVDPPYRRASERDRGEYGVGAMRDADLGRLISAVKRASRRGAKVLISYNADLSFLLPNWNHEQLSGRHLISADPAKRRMITEFTCRNY